MARPGLLIFENALQSRCSGSHLLFSCHLPLLVQMMSTVITILEHVSCARNFDLNNSSATLEFSALVCKQGCSFGGKLENGGARL